MASDLREIKLCLLGVRPPAAACDTSLCAKNHRDRFLDTMSFAATLCFFQLLRVEMGPNGRW
jgi:hypothetical protein